MKVKDRKRLLDRAFTKAARVQPGQDSPLAPLEQQVLEEAIEAYNARRARTFDKFFERLHAQDPEISYLRAKLLFAQLCFEERIEF